MTVVFDPAARTTGGASRAPAGGGGGDWMREFQVAGRMAWFHAPNQRQGADALKLADPGSRQSQTSGRGQPSLGAAPTASVQGASPGLMQPSPFASLRPEPFATQPGQGPTAATTVGPDRDALVPVSRPMSGDAKPLPVTPLAPAPRPSSLPSSPKQEVALPPLPFARVPRQALRVHVEESVQGLVVWLGVDDAAPGQAPRTAGVAAELRRHLALSGQRLAALICNGEPVDVVSKSNVKEPGWPSIP